MAWYDFFRIFQYSFEEDPQTKLDKAKDMPGAGFASPDLVPNIRNGDTFGNGNKGMYRVGNDFIDLSSVSNRISRYKEYERLRSLPEIEQVMTVIADEACLAGETGVQTLYHGVKSIQWLAENMKDEFFVYCWDFEKEDYTLGVAYKPRFVKKAPTRKVILDDGTYFIATHDHLVLLRNQAWANTGQLQIGDLLMPFYRIPANNNLTKNKYNQFPRIFTHRKGWVHERQFINEWKTGKNFSQYEKVNKSIRMITGGLNTIQTAELMDCDRSNINLILKNEGFSYKEIKWLSKFTDTRRIVSISEHEEVDTYDLSVKEHKNFCGEGVIFHNCQKNSDGAVLKINTKNNAVKKELDFLLLHRKMLNLNKKAWEICKKVCINGDYFSELMINMDNPKDGILKMQELPCDSMYRIETTKGRLVEFQQSGEGPDYEALAKSPVIDATEAELEQSKAIRFTPNQVIHIRIGEDRKTFYPYGQSLIEPARGPANQLRLMEDAMVVYRLCIRTYDKVTIKGGWKYMKDININDTIYVYNQQTQKVEEGKIAWHGLVGNKTTYKVKSKHTSVTGTKQHPIIVLDKETGIIDYVKISNLIPGRHFFIRPKLDVKQPKKIHRFYKSLQAILSNEQKDKYKNTIYASKKQLIIESLNAVEINVTKSNLQKCWTFLSSKDSVGVPYELGISLCEHFDLGEPIKRNQGEKNCHKINLPEYVTEEFAMLFGFLLGDGCINWHKTSGKLLFSAGVDAKLNEKYCNLLKKFFGDCSFYQDKRIDQGLGMYCINSSTACEIFENLGYLGKAHSKRIPSWVFEERPEIRKALVLGFADADGLKRGMNKKGIWNTTIRLCNRELVEDIKQVWESLGYHASEAKEIKNAERWFGENLVPESIHWEIYISETEVPFHDEIISIRKDKKEPVYDLTVEHATEHNFLCNGVPVSNTRAPERRVFYIDTGNMAPYRAESFMQRMQDLLRKKKSVRPGEGNSAVDERWSPPPADEDIWVPVRPNSQTRIDTLPGAQNLGEIDDTVYFRNKLYVALNFPANYFSNEDTGSTRITLSSQIVKFARMIERIQESIEDALWEICDRHLTLRGFPEESYDDLQIKMTAPSEWRELSRAEVENNRINNANALKGSLLYSDWDILTKILKLDEEETEMMLSRMKVQKLEEARLQILVTNPQLMGVGTPGENDDQMGAEPGGPNPMLGPDDQQGQPPNPEGQPPEGNEGAAPGGPPPQTQEQPAGHNSGELPEADLDDIKKYDLEIQNYDAEQDAEEVDWSET